MPSSRSGWNDARVVQRCCDLGVFGVDAESDLETVPGGAHRFDPTPETIPLVEGVEDDMVYIAQQFVELLLDVCGGIDVYLPAHLLGAEPSLEQRTGRDAREGAPHEREDGVHGEALQGE